MLFKAQECLAAEEKNMTKFGRSAERRGIGSD